jgi:hypothetical protein
MTSNENRFKIDLEEDSIGTIIDPVSAEVTKFCQEFVHLNTYIRTQV